MLDYTLQPQALGAYLYTLTLIGAIAYALAPLADEPTASTAAAAAATDGSASGGGTEGGGGWRVKESANEIEPLLEPASPHIASTSSSSSSQPPPPSRARKEIGSPPRAPPPSPPRHHHLTLHLIIRVTWRALLGATSLVMLGM